MGFFNNYSFDDKHVVITGGSEGIGFSIGEFLVRNRSPSRVTLLARNTSKLLAAKEKLESIAKSKSGPKSSVSIFVTSCDVGDPKSVDNAFMSITTNVAVDVLVNCAGLCIPGVLEDLKVDEIDQMIDVNLKGSLLLTQKVLPTMKAQKSGSVVFVSSQAGMIGLYGMTAYCATKYAIRGLAESLRMELKPYNVNVSVAFPADTNTPGYAKENVGKPEITRKISGVSGLISAEDTAKTIIKGIEGRNFFIQCNFDGHMLGTLAAGAGPCTSRNCLKTVLEILLLPVFRLVALGYQVYFSTVVKSGLKEDREKNRNTNTSQGSAVGKKRM